MSDIVEDDLTQPHTRDPKVLGEWFSDEHVIYWMGIEAACHKAHENGDKTTEAAYEASKVYAQARVTYNKTLVALLGFDPNELSWGSDVPANKVAAISLFLQNNHIRELEREYKRVHALYVLEVQKWHESLQDKQADSANRARTKVKTTSIPLKMPQQTFAEMRAAGTAIADGRTGKRWQNVEGQIALRHIVDKQNLEILLREGNILEWWGLPSTHGALREELQHLGIDGWFLLQFVMVLALEETNRHVSLTLDELIQLIGKSADARRSSKNREEWRRWVWRALLIFSNLSVVGIRRGRYKVDGEVQDMTRRAQDAFISITGKEWDVQTDMDGSTPPQVVHYVCGPWLEPYRGNQQILTQFGDLRRLARISSGKASGSWARSIGLGLNQRWRELAAYSETPHVGNNNKRTVILKDCVGNDRFFTRRELLLGETLFRADPDAESILNGEHPGFACDYWNQAIALLKEEFIGSYAEVGSVSTKGYNWADAWLDQQLDIQPKKESIADIAAIGKSADSAKARMKRTKTTKT